MKKTVVFLLLSVLTLSMTGCSLAKLTGGDKEGKESSKEEDYDGYDRIRFENGQFYIPEDANEDATGSSANICFQGDDYIFVAGDVTDAELFDEDEADMISNLEEYFSDELDFEFTGNEKKVKSSNEDDVDTVMFSEAELEGCTGKLSYVKGEDFEIFLFAGQDGDTFSKDQIETTVKSLEYYKGSKYTLTGEAPEAVTEEATTIEEATTTEEATTEEATTEEETTEDGSYSSSDSLWDQYLNSYTVASIDMLSGDMTDAEDFEDYLSEFEIDLLYDRNDNFLNAIVMLTLSSNVSTSDIKEMESEIRSEFGSFEREGDYYLIDGTGMLDLEEDDMEYFTPDMVKSTFESLGYTVTVY